MRFLPWTDFFRSCPSVNREIFPTTKTLPTFISVLALSLSPAADSNELPASPLRETVPGLRIQARAYPEQRATEWQLRLHAPESGELPLHENLKSADFEVAFPSDAPVMLHWSKGSHSEPSDFEPKTESLVAGKTFSLESFGGRSSDGGDALLQSCERRQRAHRVHRLDG